MAENDTMPADGGIGPDADAQPAASSDADPFAGVVDLDAVESDDAAAVDEAPTDDDADEQAEAEEADPDQDDDAETDAEDEEAEDEAEPDEVKLHFGGREFELPAGATVKEAQEQIQAYLNESWAANTRKSQEVAELRKTAETTLQQAEKVQGMSDEALQAFIAARTAQQQIQNLSAQLQQVDPNQDMDSYRVISDRLAMAKQAYQQAEQMTARAEQASEAERTELLRQRHEAGVAEIKKQVPKFDEAAVLAYAKERFGIDVDQAKAVYGTNPAAAIAMYESMMYRRGLQQSKAKKTAAPKAPVKGGVKSSAAPASTSDPNAMTDAQFAKYLGLR